MASSVVGLKQKGPLCDRKGERANVAPLTQEAPLMRLSVASLRRMVKRPLHVEFVQQQLTSYSGLELLWRYLRQCELPSRLRAACGSTGGDYGGGPPPPPPPAPFFGRGPPAGAPPVSCARPPFFPLFGVGPGPPARPARGRARP